MNGLKFTALGAALCVSACAAVQDAPGSAPVAQGRDAAIAAWLTRELGAQDSLEGTRYALAWSDLDGDGSDEAIVHLAGPMQCGTGGCTTIALMQEDGGWRVVMDASVSRLPVTVLDTRSQGWRDLTVDIGGGGGRSGTVRMRFDGVRYPSNPSALPKEMIRKGGFVLIPAEPEYRALGG